MDKVALLIHAGSAAGRRGRESYPCWRPGATARSPTGQTRPEERPAADPVTLDRRAGPGARASPMAVRADFKRSTDDCSREVFSHCPQATWLPRWQWLHSSAAFADRARAPIGPHLFRALFHNRWHLQADDPSAAVISIVSRRRWGRRAVRHSGGCRRWMIGLS